jgi:hypothetical protein
MKMAVFLVDFLTIIEILIIIGLVSIMLYIYIQNYRAIKVSYSLGLVLFALAIIIDNSIALFNYIDYSTENTFDMITLFGNLIEILAFSILLKITWDN